MFSVVWRWMTKSRRRSIFCLSIALVIFIAVTIGWREFCLWQVRVHIAVRQDSEARAWLTRSLPGLLPDARIFLIESKLARRSGKLSEVNPILAKAKGRGAPSAEIERETLLLRAQRLQFESFTMQDWANLIADPRDDEPEVARAYVAWANSMFQVKEAMVMLETWKKDYPEDPDPDFLLGQIFAGMSNWEGAEECYRRALRLGPNRPDIQAELGSVLAQTFKNNEAVHWFRESLKIQPKSEKVSYHLAQALLVQGKLDEAKKATLDGLSSFPDDPDLLKTLGEILVAEGDFTAAIEPLKQAYSSRTEDASLAYILANALQSAGRKEDAKPLFNFVSESRLPLGRLKDLTDQMISQPNDIETRYQVAFITGKYKSRQEAKRWFQNLLRIAPYHKPTHLALAELYQATGEKLRAEQHRQIASRL